MSTDQIRALILAVICALCATAGWFVTRSVYRAEIKGMEADYAKQRQAQAEANAQALAEAQGRNDLLIDQLAAAERARSALSEEKRREIKRLTSGRVCLSGDVVRLLNASAMPNSPTTPIGSAIAADAGFASDTDVAEWVDTARLYYGRCQDRVNALIQFFNAPLRTEMLNHE